MTLRTHYTATLLLLAFLLLCVPWVASAAGSFIQEALWGIVVAFFGLFVGLAAALLDVAVNEYVIGFGNKFLHSGVGSAVDILWVAVRDIFNLTFIFGLVFIGFKMILNSDDSNTRRWLVNLILAALLVNFSLFITKFVVDFTNITATQIALAFPADGGGPAVSISDGFMNALNIQKTLGISHSNIPGGLETSGAYGFIFGSAILFIVMIFVFAAGGIMLLIRYAALCLYMVFSPLMFLGWVFPQMQSVTSKYWHGFLGRAFFAPVYLLLVYFSLYVLVALYGQKALTEGTPNYLFGGGGDKILGSFSATFPPFILSCVFLIASIVVAGKLSADGSSAALSLGRSASNWTQKKVKGAAMGTARGVGKTAAYLPAAGLRRGSYALGNKLDQQIKRMQQSDGRLGKIARSNAVTDLSGKATGGMKNAKFGLARTKDEEKKMSAETNQAVRKRNEADENDNKLRVAQLGYETQVEALKVNNLSDDERVAATKKRDDYDSEVALRTGKLTDEQLLNMNEADMARFNRHMSDKQLETYYDRQEDGQAKLSQAKNDRGEETFKNYTDVVDKTTASATELATALKGLGDTVKNLSEERLKGMNISQLTDERIATHLSEDQIKTLQTSGNFSAAQITQIKQARESGINKSIKGNLIDTSRNTNAHDPAKAAEFAALTKTQKQNIFKQSVADIGKLPVSVFKDENSYEFITPAMLEARIKNGVDPIKDVPAIRTALEDYLLLTPGTSPSQNGHIQNNNPWVKWENSSSIHAAQLFA